MFLTKEEKELFEIENFDEMHSISTYIETYLMKSLHENSKEVNITSEFIKRIVLQVLENRNINIDENISYNINEICEEITKGREGFEDFNVSYLEDYNLLNRYLFNKFKDMEISEMEKRYVDLNGKDGIGGLFYFNGFNNKFINEIYEYIDDLRKELYREIISDSEIVGNDEKIEVVDEIQSIQSDWVVEFDEFDEEPYEWETTSQMEESTEITDSELIDIVKFLNIRSELIDYQTMTQKIISEIGNFIKNQKLQEYYNNKAFIEELKNIIKHDETKHKYLFHGTQGLKPAEMICQEGLGMMRNDLSSTTYSEMTMDELLLYSRGFSGEIGSRAIVIIDNPIDENGYDIPIVSELDNPDSIHMGQSGLQGLNTNATYVIDSKFIIGYVDKENKKIIYNPKYYDYNKGHEEKKKGYEDCISDDFTRISKLHEETNAIKHDKDITNSKENLYRKGDYGDY